MIFNAFKITVKYKGNSDQILCNCGNCDNYQMSYPSKSNKGTEYYNGIYVNKAELTWSSLDKFVYLFCGCSNIIYVDLSEFNTYGITEMTGMFKNCYSLVSLKFADNTFSSAKSMGGFFQGCTSLVSLDLSFFQGNNVENIDGMFIGCTSLVSLDLSNFKGQNVIGMGQMFNGCKSLISLDLSSFCSNKIQHMDKVFMNCINLQFINLKNISISGSTNIANIFDLIPKNYVACVDYGKARQLYNLVNNSNCAVISCEGDWREAQKKLDEDGNCYQDCKSMNKYEYKYECYTKCPNGTLPNMNMKCIDCILNDNCLWCSFLNAADNSCFNCSKGYYEIYNSSETNKKCYNSLEGYYLDTSDFFYKPCYPSCKTCNIKGNDEKHNCLTCKTFYPLKKDYTNYFNYYQTNDYYYATNILNEKLYYIEDFKYPEEYIYYKFRNNCYKKCPLGLIEQRNSSLYYCIPKYILSINNKSQLVIDIQEYLTYVFDGTEVRDGFDLEIPGKGIFAEITTPQNQKINEINSTKSTINLDDCLSLLKQDFNMNNTTEQFYIFKMDIEEEGINIPIIEYELYYQQKGQNLKRINLTKCSNTKIDISIPIKLQKDLFMHNPSSEYYNDRCIKAKSESGTDICLKDRRNEFIEKNLTLCQENCELIDYDFNMNKSKCKCDIKINLPIINEVRIDKEKLKKSFTNVKGYFTNIDVVKCYKIVFIKNNLVYNLGFFISIFLGILLLICLILFYCKYYKELKKQICVIVNAIKNVNKYNKEKQTLIDKSNKLNKNIKNIKESKSLLIDVMNKNKNIINNIKKNTINNINNKRNIINNNNTKNLSKQKKGNTLSKNSFQNAINSFLKKKKGNNPPVKNNNKSKTINNDITNIKNNILTSAKNALNKGFNNNMKNKNNNSLYEKNKKILEYNDNEKNSLSYSDALKYDKRTFVQYYISLLKIKNLFLFSFFPNRDYNSRIIKIFFFFFSFFVELTVNSLFYDDDTMHQIYIDKGKFNFLYQIPQIVFATLISKTAISLISFFSFSEKDIIKIKNYKNKKEDKNIDKKKLKVLNKLKIKFAVFFVVAFIIIGVFGFYITCFCGVYINTQIHLIKDTGISFILSLITPFVINLLPGILRIPALRAKKGNMNIMYKLSTFIEIF